MIDMIIVTFLSKNVPSLYEPILPPGFAENPYKQRIQIIIGSPVQTRAYQNVKDMRKARMAA